MGRKILSWSVILAGEALIIAAFLLWGKYEQNVMILNIVATSVVFALLGFDFLFPWFDLKERSQKRIGSISVWWFAATIYSIAALAVVFLWSSTWPFSLLLIVHLALLLLLVLGLIASMGVADTVETVFVEQQAQRAGVDDMKRAARKLQTKVECCVEPISPDHKGRINELVENLRFVTPANVDEAVELEREFVEVVSRLALRFDEYSLNQQTIERELREAEGIYRTRKSIFSN